MFFSQLASSCATASLILLLVGEYPNSVGFDQSGFSELLPPLVRCMYVCSSPFDILSMFSSLVVSRTSLSDLPKNCLRFSFIFLRKLPWMRRSASRVGTTLPSKLRAILRCVDPVCCRPCVNLCARRCWLSGKCEAK